MAKTTQDLVRLTGLSRQTVHRGIASGELPGYKVGTAYFCTDEAFELLRTNQWVPRPKPTFVREVVEVPEPSSFSRKAK